VEENLIWMDLEMTGLEPEESVIVEIATIITDGQLAVVAEGPIIAIHHSEEVLAAMDGWSRSQHTASGLVDRIRTSPYDCLSAEEATLAFISQHSRPGVSPLCGNSIWQDRRFLVKYMPRVNAFLHHRNVDVSSIKELVRRWYPHLPPYRKKKVHTAISDIMESLNELRHYRKTVFIASGNPEEPNP